MSAAVMDDEQIIAGIVEWAKREGKVPGQNRIMAEYGIGKSRVVRLLADVDQRMAADRDQAGPARNATTSVKQSGPGRKSSPDRTEHGDADQSGGNGVQRTDTAASPDQSGPDVSRGESSGPVLDRDATQPIPVVSDRTEPSADRTDATEPGPDRTEPPASVAGPDQPTVSADRTEAQTGSNEKETPDRTAAQQPVSVRTTAQAARNWMTLDPGQTDDDSGADRRIRSWPILLLALPAFVAIWSGWVGLGGLTGFGVVHPLPGIADAFEINTAITLPIGVETYAAYALRVWLSGGVPERARQFAKVSAILSLALGAAGQVAYHLMVAARMTLAPWQITTLVACIPVAVLGMGATLAHLIHRPGSPRRN